jgi:hypothetical protein
MFQIRSCYYDCNNDSFMKIRNIIGCLVTSLAGRHMYKPEIHSELRWLRLGGTVCASAKIPIMWHWKVLLRGWMTDYKPICHVFKRLHQGTSRNVKIIPVFTAWSSQRPDDGLDSRWLNNDLHVYDDSIYRVQWSRRNVASKVDICLEIGRKLYIIMRYTLCAILTRFHAAVLS